MFSVAKHYDSQGRLKYIRPDVKLTLGHSVCNVCKKDMPKVWDVVCHRCNHTFCYEHALTLSDYWYCLECAPKAVDDELA